MRRCRQHVQTLLPVVSSLLIESLHTLQLERPTPRTQSESASPCCIAKLHCVRHLRFSAAVRLIESRRAGSPVGADQTRRKPRACFRVGYRCVHESNCGLRLSCPEHVFSGHLRCPIQTAGSCPARVFTGLAALWHWRCGHAALAEKACK